MPRGRWRKARVTHRADSVACAHGLLRHADADAIRCSWHDARHGECAMGYPPHTVQHATHSIGVNMFLACGG